MSRADERGTSIVESALMLPVLVLFLLGMLDFGLAVYSSNALANAARDGARFASVDPTNEDCIAAAAAARSSLARLEAADVEVSWGTLNIDQPVTVTVESEYEPVTPFIAELIGAETLTLRSAATMRIRHLPTVPLACP